MHFLSQLSRSHTEPAPFHAGTATLGLRHKLVPSKCLGADHRVLSAGDTSVCSAVGSRVFGAGRRMEVALGDTLRCWGSPLNPGTLDFSAQARAVVPCFRQDCCPLHLRGSFPQSSGEGVPIPLSLKPGWCWALAG